MHHNYIEEINKLQRQLDCKNRSEQSLGAYLKSLGEAVERGTRPDPRLSRAESVAEAVLAMLDLYTLAHPDASLQQLQAKLVPMVQAWRQSQSPGG